MSNNISMEKLIKLSKEIVNENDCNDKEIFYMITNNSSNKGFSLITTEFSDENNITMTVTPLKNTDILE